MWHERRNHHRRFLDYLLEIEGEMQNGQVFQDMATLVNISTGGAQFTTLYKERYFVGQSLQASLFLSETRDGKDGMKTMAHVIRINESKENVLPNSVAQANISIHFTEPFHLVR